MGERQAVDKICGKAVSGWRLAVRRGTAWYNAQVSRQWTNALFLVLFFAFAFLHLYRLGAVTYTWDEGSDLGIVSCLQQTHDPFACLDDISQTRLPFYIHALAHSPRAQYVISFVFSLFNFVLAYAFARREFGRLAATLTAALFATSPALLASGRMLLTHSNVIFTTFTLLSFLCLRQYERTMIPRPARGERVAPQAPGEGRPGRILPSGAPHPALLRSATFSPRAGRRIYWLVACAVASGAAVASHALGLFNLIPLAIFYAMAVRPRRLRDLALYALVASAAFFAATIVYVKPAIFGALVQACLHPGAYPFWNVLGLGSPRAPWYFPFLILEVKVGPWLLFLAFVPRKRWTFAFLLGFFIALLLKGFVFHYEAPHHQVQFYPLLYVCIGAAIARVWRPWIAAAVALLFAWQLYDVVRFFPNYLFYGAQYGERMVGEFYGPAVMHDQDKGPINAYVDALLAREPDAKILVEDHNALERSGPNFVRFSKRDPNAVYEYAFDDWLYTRHFRFEETAAFNRFIAANYAPKWTYFFPPHFPMYRILHRVTRGTSHQVRGREADLGAHHH